MMGYSLRRFERARGRTLDEGRARGSDWTSETTGGATPRGFIAARADVWAWRAVLDARSRARDDRWVSGECCEGIARVARATTR